MLQHIPFFYRSDLALAVRILVEKYHVKKKRLNYHAKFCNLKKQGLKTLRPEQVTETPGHWLKVVSSWEI
jgi:hypothetical protein